ncbi:NfeD family protein [Vibrio fortis]|uniref:NfeD family protein n=1 Tax=Vibrio fortis TaxID=212667 RepID=UPI004067D106
MIELLDQVNHWHWLAFGLLLLGLELLGTAGYFLWIGLSAMIVGALLGALPLSWQMQWLSFASFSLITTWLWWRRQLKSDRKSDKARVLNQRDKQLIGKTTRLEDDIQKGKCRIRLGDTTWSAITATDITAGTEVVVTAVDGIVLTIAPVNK